MNPDPAANLAPGLLRRLAAMAYESIIACAVLLAGLLLPHVLLAAFTGYIAATGTLWAHLFLLLLVYFVWFWSHGRQTLPMKTWRIRLLTREGHGLRPERALLRYLLCWPSLGLGGIGLLWALVDRDGQFLHDRLAGTRLLCS